MTPMSLVYCGLTIRHRKIDVCGLKFCNNENCVKRIILPSQESITYSDIYFCDVAYVIKVHK